MKLHSHISVFRKGLLTLSGVLIVSLSASSARAEEAQDALERSELNSQWREVLHSAINGEDYLCDSTAFQDWVDAEVDRIGLPTLFGLLIYGAFDWAILNSWLLDQDPSDDVIGSNGEYTREIGLLHRQHQRFWSVPIDDVQLYGMSGAVLADDSKMVPVIQLQVKWRFGVDISDEEANRRVDIVQDLIETNMGYDHPFLTMNAIAVKEREAGFLGLDALPDKVIIGEGVLQIFNEIGLGAPARKFLHAHEIAHQVQFEIEGLNPDPLPEDTRRLELMADAFGSYYCAHRRGGRLRSDSILEAFNTAFNLGDCLFESVNHHGTPRQREASAVWGASLATSGRPRILSAENLFELFDAELPNLVAPDAP